MQEDLTLGHFEAIGTLALTFNDIEATLDTFTIWLLECREAEVAESLIRGGSSRRPTG